MSIAVTVANFRPSFRLRPLGFDRGQVLAFVSNLIGDYERAVRDLDHARQELHVAHEGATEQPSGTAAQGVERIFVAAERIADEIEDRAKGEAARLLAEATARAADVLTNAERRAADTVEAARKEAGTFGEQVASMRLHYAQLRAAFELAADTAASALSEIAAQEHRSESLAGVY